MPKPASIASDRDVRSSLGKERLAACMTRVLRSYVGSLFTGFADRSERDAKSRYSNGFASFGSGSAKPKDEKPLILEDEIVARKTDFPPIIPCPRAVANSLGHESGTGFIPRSE